MTVAATVTSAATTKSRLIEPVEVTAEETSQARFSVRLRSAAEVTAIFIAVDCVAVLLNAAVDETAVLIAHARLTICVAPPTVVAAVVACPAMLSVLLSAVDVVATACAAAAKLKPSDTLADKAAVVVAEPNSANPRVIWAVVPAVAAPPTAMFFVSEAAAVGLAAPVTAPARLSVRPKGAAVLAAQFTDAASDWRIPELPFNAAAFRAEPFSSIHYLTD
jgi:hypothetical protein